MRILVLGGTAEARALAKMLVEAHIPVVSSLAGRVKNPRLPAGEVRIGGFGGIEGLATYMSEAKITTLIDATHPYARKMHDNSIAAGMQMGLPCLRLQRPSWIKHPLARTWQWFDSYYKLVFEAETLAYRPFITTGRQTLPFYENWLEDDAEIHPIIRVVEPLKGLPINWSTVESRGPYDYATEHAFMDREGVDTLITKDSGGLHTMQKLFVAASFGIPILVKRRPKLSPDWKRRMQVSTPIDAFVWVQELQ